MIELLTSLRLSGAVVASGAVVNLDPGVEADLVNRGVAAYQESAVPPSSARKLGIMADGDSLTARHQREYQVLSASAADGLATYTTNGSHLFLPGMNSDIHSMTGSSLYEGRGTIVGVPSATTFTETISAAAPSSGGTGFCLSNHQKNDVGWLWWAEGLSGLDFGVLNTVGRGARRSARMLSDYAAMVLSQNPEAVILFPPVNDVTGSQSAAHALGNLEAMIRMTIQAGALPIVLTSSCYGGAYNTTSNNAAQWKVSRGAALLAKRFRVPSLDTYEIIVDQASATAAPKANFMDTADQLHLAGASAKAIGEALHPLLSRLGFGTPIRLCNSAYDVSTASGSTNLLANSTLAGTAGTKTTGSGAAVLGSVADNWTLTNSGLATQCDGSKGTSPIGASQIVTFNGVANFFTLDNTTSFHASLVPGKVLRCCAKLALNFTGTARIAVGLGLTPTGGQLGNIYAFGNHLATAPSPAGNYTLNLHSVPFRIPAGATYSAAKFFVQVVAMAGGTIGTAELSMPAVWQDDA